MKDVRKIRGQKLAATVSIQKKGKSWIVPSQSGKRSYRVELKDTVFCCTCPDYELRELNCIHIHAVICARKREETSALFKPPEKRRRPTYSQDWPAYNAAQTQEKYHFRILLRDLCSSLKTLHPPAKRGRPRLPLDEALFAAAYKVYSTVSGRRFMTDMREAASLGFVSRHPSYNSIFNVIGSKEMTPTIKDLIRTSAHPLRSLEADFAVDSSGYTLDTSYNYYSRRGYVQYAHDYLKLHAMVGVKTQIITEATVTDRDAHDLTQFVELVGSTAERFKLEEVSADKAYLSNESLEFVAACGAKVYIPFKSNSRTNPKLPLWNKLFHFYMYHREEFLPQYHKRSNVEAAFGAMKKKFWEGIRSRTPIAQHNELLLKVLVYNIVCVIHSMYEFGIEAEFEELLPKNDDECPENGFKLV